MAYAPDTVAVSRYPAPFRRFGRMVAVMRHEPALAIGAGLTLVFAYLIVAPVISILLQAVLVQPGDAARLHQGEGSLTLYYMVRAFASRMSGILLWSPLVHTLTIAAGTVAMSVSLGVVLAWLVNRTDLFGRGWFATALVVPFMLPTWTFALAWTTIFKNGVVGGQPGWLQAMGFATPNWLAYGTLPIIVILVLHYTPLVVLIVGNALQVPGGSHSPSCCRWCVRRCCRPRC
jgi:iron(III) transport system permease protein